VNKGIIIGIIIAIAIGIGASVTAFSYYGSDENPDLVDSEGGSEPKQFTVNLEEQVGFQEQPP